MTSRLKTLLLPILFGLVTLCAAGCSDDATSADTGMVDDSSTSDLAADAGNATPCANVPAYAGDLSWQQQLIVESSSRQCSASVSGSSGNLVGLAEALAKHTQLSVVPGTYNLPDTVGTHALTLPFCLSDAMGNHSSPAGAGSVLVTDSPFAGGRVRGYVLTQPVSFNGQMREIVLNINQYETSGAPLKLDDLVRHATPTDTIQETYFRLDNADPLFPCELGEATENTTTATFDRGMVKFTLLIPAGLACGGGCPLVITKAEGTFDGTPFVQSDPFELAHLYYHHNVGGLHLVRLPQPVGQVCALRFDLEHPAIGSPSGSTLDCSLTEIDALVNVAFTQTGFFGP